MSNIPQQTCSVYENPSHEKTQLGHLWRLYVHQNPADERLDVIMREHADTPYGGFLEFDNGWQRNVLFATPEDEKLLTNEFHLVSGSDIFSFTSGKRQLHLNLSLDKKTCLLSENLENGGAGMRHFKLRQQTPWPPLMALLE